MRTTILACALAGVGLAHADQPPDVDRESVAHANWRAAMAQNSTPAEGCFHASYPNIVWERMDCRIGQPRAHPVHLKRKDAEAEVTGNGYDYAAKATGLISSATGGFAIRGVISEVGVGIAAYKDAGILGPNDYTVQLNTNANETSFACVGHSGCTVWQQFVYATDSLEGGEAAVFMQYWLLNWGASSCPGNWRKEGADCWKNSYAVEAPDVPITDLGNVQLSGTATPGGNDSVTLFYGSEVSSVTARDGVLDISSVWNEAEFNVVGNAGGSQAGFNSGSSITVTLLLFDGSASAPMCAANDGTTGETNNLNRGTCVASIARLFGLPFPYIEFSESN
jgi:hypothetical protein